MWQYWREERTHIRNSPETRETSTVVTSGITLPERSSDASSQVQLPQMHCWLQSIAGVPAISED